MLDAGFYHYKTLSAFDSMRLNGQVLGERDFVDFDNSVDEDNSHVACIVLVLLGLTFRCYGWHSAQS